MNQKMTTISVNDEGSVSVEAENTNVGLTILQLDLTLSYDDMKNLINDIQAQLKQSNLLIIPRFIKVISVDGQLVNSEK